MRRPSLDLSEPSRALEEPIGAPTPDISEPEDIVSLPLGHDFIHALDLDVDGDPSSFSDSAPPPHLAARFYRPSQTRRKDSAASSRRNSISSLHSLPSSHSAAQLASAPQSKHVANHQRRDAILKDRQKRLADRAAHVEKVRVRAAMAKERTIALSVERAAAAQQARERNLKEIAAACAEEVKRAKAIAETTKEKREQDLRKMRQQMEERQAEAERRREELRKQTNRARGSSLGSKKSVEALPLVTDLKATEPKLPLAEDAAVCRLQTWWRTMTRRQVVYGFSQLGLTIDGVSETPYENVMELLAQQQVIMLTARILNICGLRQGSPNSVDQMKAVRCFLSAFLILGHPAQVLSNTYNVNFEDQASPAQPIPRDDLTNPLIQEVVGKAKDLLITFENTLSRLTSFNNYTVPPALAPTLPHIYSSFETAFLNWKSRDKHALVDGMLGQLVELDALLEHVKETSEPSVIEQYKEGMAPNQTTLIARIKNLIGREQGLKVIRQAIHRARKARADKREQERSSMKPRVADQSMTPESALADLGTSDIANKNRLENLGSVPVASYPSPPSTPANKPSARKPVSKGKLLPDNRIVVHELAINKEYCVRADDFLEAETKALQPLLQQMRATMHGTDELSREMHFRLLLKVAQFIRDKLQRLVKPTNSIHNIIGDLLDVEQFEQRFRNGSFSYEGFFATMGSLLPKLCAPVRDEQARDLVENKLSQGSYVDRLEALIIFIDIMLVDYANHLLSVVGPQLLQFSADYEAKSFAGAIQQGEHGLFAAETAWRAARNKVIAETSRRDPENINHPKNRPTAEKIYVHMLVDIFTQTSKMRYGQVPEMLQLDYKRVRKYGHLTRNIITTSGILLQCKNLLKRDVRVPWKTEAARIMIVLDTAGSEEVAVTGVMAALEAGRSMPPAIKGHLRGFVQKLIAAHREMVSTSQSEPNAQWEPTAHDPTQPVLKLLLKRLRDHMITRMCAASNSEKAKATNLAGEKLASSGLAEFVDRVREIVDMMTKVGTVDREAHAHWWETVAEKVDAEDAIKSTNSDGNTTTA